MFRIASPLLPLLLALHLPAQDTANLQSPDGNLQVLFEAPSGQLAYSVRFHGKPLVERSALLLEFHDRALGSKVRMGRQTPASVDQEYRLVAGKSSTARDHYNSLTLETEELSAPGQRLTMEARAYDDAVAFRYVVPAQSGMDRYALTRERTEFRISKDAVTYALVLPNYRSSYESEYIKLNASAFAGKVGLSQTNLIGLPLLMEVPGVAWMAITEADLRGNSAMYLVNPGTGWGDHRFEARVAPPADLASGGGDVLITGTLPHHSAWRVLMVGEEPGRLIESNVLTSLNPPSTIADSAWIQSGLAAWDWWSGSLGADGKPAFTTATMKYFVDFAAKSGFPYMLVDAGWAAHHDITKMNGSVDIPELVKYAAPKHVKIWIWMHHDEVDRQMNEAFPLFAQWGVAGLKIDFVERDDQAGIEFYYRCAELAARNHLMVDFHGATKPWGLERTYPNVLGYEAVLGMEQNKAGARDTPEHRAMLPFTRMLAGPMDYTPGGFSNVTREEFAARGTAPLVMGTRAQQLAMYAIYDAPFQMVSDSPKAYADQPAFDFIEHAPATWDETKVLGGRPGEFITMARRHGEEWFVGSLTNWNAREMDVSLSFLPAGRKYRAEVYADSADAAEFPKGVAVTKQMVDSTVHLKAKLASGGGYAVRLVPVS